MAEIAYGSILESKPCHFVVGPQKKKFFIHASLAASQSPALHSLVNGSTDGAKNACTVWEGVDEATFVRFGQYVYTGDYEGSAPFEPPAAVPEEEANGSTGEAFAPTLSEPPEAADRVLPEDEPALAEPVPCDSLWDEPSVHEPVKYWRWGEPVPAELEPEPEPEPEPEHEPEPEPAKVEPEPEPAKVEPEPEQAPDGEGFSGLVSSKRKKYKKTKIKAVAPKKEIAEPPAVATSTVALPQTTNDGWGFYEKPKKTRTEAVAPKEAVAEPPAVATSTTASPQTRNDAWDSFTTERSYDCGVAEPHSAPDNKDASTEYADVFLSHARVHMMADHYDVGPLAQLALHKLHRILCRFTLHDERIGDVVALLRYCFAADKRPLLRDLVSAFAACHVKQLWANAEFQELFAAYGELSRAMMENMIKRLH